MMLAERSSLKSDNGTKMLSVGTSKIIIEVGPSLVRSRADLTSD